MFLSLLHTCPNSYLSLKARSAVISSGEPSTTTAPPRPPALCSSAHWASISALGCDGLKVLCLLPWPRCSRRPCCLCVPTLSPGPAVGQVQNSMYQMLLSWPWPSSHLLPACPHTFCVSFKPQLRLHFLWKRPLTSQTQEGVLLCQSFLHAHDCSTIGRFDLASPLPELCEGRTLM